ncbi:MAG: Eco57I restriction-modification methylase domain-containing protein [Chloroflexi bacterium]|nr:Eco57I restriction-modification methylase domain-containing protein [Chloroflexota bacterium]
MQDIEPKKEVWQILHEFTGLEPLKKLFWEYLNYDRVNEPISMAGWGHDLRGSLAGPPLLFAAAGDGQSFYEGFQIIYLHLASDKLLLSPERLLINKLIQSHPDSLFVFSDKAQERWHFVNVKPDTKTAKRHVIRRITVGREERLRTAAERISLLDLDKMQPGLFGVPITEIRKAVDTAFDVEKVTKKFFEEYARVFAKAEKLISGFSDSDRKRLFTQRLFNRLMFLAFVEKKGWLRYQGQTGYLSSLWKDYRRSMPDEDNFYRDRLKPLFFAALNTKHEVDVIGIRSDGVLNNLVGEVPYLNGGLFELHVDDENPDVMIPDEAIRDILTDLFDRFNFTVTESTPLDIEVAVDPEMLGKVFEELVTGRHDTGSYYTPKPIVSFMCREVLKGYLQSALPSENEENIERFVDEHDPAGLRDPEAVLQVLRDVKVCDPACGSGAYLLGMLHELLDLRASLFAVKNLDPISTYNRKLEIIQQNLYGVDIDPFAVNIARLRLWLSLAVDFDGPKPEPLPNLDFKIEPGDSILSPSPERKDGEYLSMRDHLVERYSTLKQSFLVAHGEEKRALRKEAAQLRADIAHLTHVGQSFPGFDWPVEFAEVFKDSEKDGFGSGGFDIVVANPPYVRQELIKDIKPDLKRFYPEVYCGTADLYCYFYTRAIEMLRADGMLAFISSNKWFRAGYGANLRKYVAEHCDVRSITDFGELPVFQNAATFPMIFVARKGQHEESQVFTQVKSLAEPYPDVLALVKENGQALPPNAISGHKWTLADAHSANILRRMEAGTISLGEYVNGQIYRGILTGFNTAFVIDGAKRSELIAQDPKSSEIIKPLAVGDDIRKWRVEDRDRWLIVTKIGVDIKRYPAIFAHLKQWQKELENRQDQGEHWWELRACAYYDAFEGPKIVYPEICKEPRFALDDQGLYLNNKVFLVNLDDPYLLGVLNSDLAWLYAKSICAVLGDEGKGGRVMLQWANFRSLPIPIAGEHDRLGISALAIKCAQPSCPDRKALELEIDERVARLYGISVRDLASGKMESK